MQDPHRPAATVDFYDELAPLYHLIYPDWGASMARQGEQLAGIIDSEWPGHTKVLDVSCGIGTQAIALAERGYSVTGSDLSPKEVERARREAAARGLRIGFSAVDMRHAHQAHGAGFDVVMSCDNSVTHLPDDEALLLAFRQMHACLKPGGGCLITVRDYDKEERGRNLVKHYGARIENNHRYVLFQTWDFEGNHYDLSLFIVVEALQTRQVVTHVMRANYYAISVVRLCDLMREAGFDKVKRMDGAFFQPVLLGTKAV